VAPGPLEGYAARFDDLFGRLAQRRGFREYLAGLLAPRERNKTLTALAGAEPVAGAQHPAVQRLQFFLSESRWDPDRVNARRLELLLSDPATAPHGGGVLVIDDSGDRKDGTRTAHVGHQWLGRYGKTDNGVVTVTTVWADERLYYPVHAVPYTPAKHFAKGKSDPGFRTKLAIGADLAVRARDAGFTFRAVAADSAYGDQDGFRAELADAGLPFVMALKPRRGTWAYGPDAHTPVDAARELAWGGPDDPGNWHPVTRTFRGHAETWYAADATLGAWGPEGPRRLVAATADPGTLPGKATWSRTWPGPAARARLAARTQPRAWPRSSGSTGSGTGLSRATSRSRTSWAGLTSRSAPTSRSAATRPSSTARSASAGTPGSPIPRPRKTLRHRGRPPAAERGGPRAALPPAPSWPRALRAIRAWLTPAIALQRWWPAWSKAPPPPQLQALMTSLAAGRGLHLYIPS
jgi:DDE superfamily endonuclease